MAVYGVGETDDPVKTGQRQMPEWTHERAARRQERAIMDMPPHRELMGVQVEAAASAGKIILSQADTEAFGVSFDILSGKGNKETAAIGDNLQGSRLSSLFVPMQGGNQNQRVFGGNVLKIPALEKGTGLAGSMII